MEGEIPLVLRPISWLIGEWETESASGQFPTIQDFSYNEKIVFRQCGQQPLLSYQAWSSHPVKKNPMHLESGFVRVTGDNRLSFMIAHNFGLTTIEEGYIQDKTIDLSSSSISRMTPSKETATVLQIERKIMQTGENKMTQVLWMKTSKTPSLTEHLRAHYVRKSN